MGGNTKDPAEQNRAAGTLTDDMRRSLIELCEKRSSTYGLLSRLYRVEVDEETYDNLQQATFPTNTGNKKVDEGYRKIATFLGCDRSSAVLDLAVDYVRVFIGHGNTAYSAAYPFESVYTSEKRLLMQEARDEIIGAYAEANLVIADDWKDPEDHVALELEYMELMSARVQKALEENDDEGALELLARQRDFLLRHLTSWLPMMTADMRRFAQTDFYQGLACLSEGFLAQDRSFLTEIIQEEA